MRECVSGKGEVPRMAISPVNLSDPAGGQLGRWSFDARGLPCFDLQVPAQGEAQVLPEGDWKKVWHQAGNSRATAECYAGGWTALYESDRGYLRLSGKDPAKPLELGGLWTLRGAAGEELLSPLSPGALSAVRFGEGYAEWRFGGGGVVVRRVWAPFGDLPLLRIDAEIAGPAAQYEERWGLAPYPLLLGGLMTPWRKAPSSKGFLERILWYLSLTASSNTRRVTEFLRRYYRARMRIHARYRPEIKAYVARFSYHGPLKSRAPEEADWIDSHPKPFFLASLGGEVESSAEERGLLLRVRSQSAGGAAKRLSFAVGWGQEEEIPALLQQAAKERFEDLGKHWKRNFHIQVSGAPWLEREASWHGYYLKSSQIHDDYFGLRILPQGSAYGYIHGIHGAPRDYVLASVPLVYSDPLGARGCLEIALATMRPSGRIYYSHTGVGKATSVGLHDKPSDLQLFLLWGLSHWIWATGETSFLDKQIPFYPKEAGKTSTVRERIEQAFRYIRDTIGRGEHGLLLVGSGDWSDPISFMVKSRRAFRKCGESVFDSAFAAWILPRAADLVGTWNPSLASEMRSFADEIRESTEKAWTGQWFLRGWDGKGRPIGDQHLFLDCQTFALLAGLGGESQCRSLVKTIREKLDDPSPIGALSLDHPHPVKFGVLTPGWDCNGGVWAALNGLLAKAYAKYDPALAWRSLEKQSLFAHARAYPNIWYGIWSGPDAYNAHDACEPGQTFVHPATPMQEYPIMNSNAHAGPLMALLACLGIEPGPSGIEIAPPDKARAWKIETPLLSASFDGKKIAGETRALEGLGGKAKVVGSKTPLGTLGTNPSP